MKLAITFTLLFVLATPVFSEGIKVRAGEHEGFTRIVLPHETGRQWKLGRTAKGYGVHWNDEVALYDLSNAFKYITKKRVSNISINPDNNILEIGLGCECYAEVKEAASSLLIIDIKNGAPKPNSPFENQLPNTKHIERQPGFNTVEQKRQPSSLETKNNETYNWLAQDISATQNPSILAIGFVSQDTPVYEADISNNLQTTFKQNLFQQLGQSASNGVIEIHPTKITLPNQTQDPSPNAKPFRVDPLPGMIVNPQKGVSLTQNGTNCPANSFLNIPSWGNGDNASKALTIASSKLASELDKPNTDDVLNAVQIYIYYGMGAEARSLINNFGAQLPNIPYLENISFLVDLEHPPKNAFEGMHSCPGFVALWSLLSAPTDSLLSGLDSKAVVRAFLLLPSQLQQHLAPEVILRLSNTNNEESASIIRRTMERKLDTDAPKLDIVEAKIALSKGDASKAEKIINHSSELTNSIEGILILAESHFLQNKPLSAKNLTALSSFTFEYKNSKHSNRLTKALTRAQALSGEYTFAFITAQEYDDGPSDVWDILARIGSDSSLLDYSGKIKQSDLKTLTPQTKLIVAKRLTDMGLWSLANEWIEGVAAPANLLAKIQLEQGNLEAAKKNIQALKEQDPDLAHTINVKASSYPELAEYYAHQGNIQQSERLQRWSGTWQAQNSEIDDNWKNLGMLGEKKAIKNTDISLQLATGLLKDSSKTRENVSNMLTGLSDKYLAKSNENP